jgi:hypothetical protein
MEAVQTTNTPSFETVWAALMENREQLKENTQGIKELRESQKETDRQLKETDRQLKETDRITKENAKLIGKLGNRFGEMVEHMVKPCLVEKFRELGFVFEKAHSDTTIEDKKNNIITEIDITLENGDKVMIVEVKSKPTTDDITDHIERMEKVRKYADLHNDRRKYLGAIAGMVISNSEKIFALKNGFYVIEPSGETFNITAPEGIYSPREW